MDAVTSLSTDVGKKAACESLSIPRSTYYRYLRPREPEVKQLLLPPLALTDEEQRRVLAVCHERRFWDSAPRQIYATLLDEGLYYCSVSTMYRILRKQNESKERRKQANRPHYEKPELLATGPNQVWSWDITKLKGPVKWTYFYLYVILDIFSRYVVGWMVAHRELAALAKRLIEDTCRKQNISEGELTIHADRGSSMTSKGVAQLLADLGVTKTHNRPHVSNDNPYSESQFKTLKYWPEFPGTFGSIQDARSFCRTFFAWYNTVHKHSGIGLVTPEQLHYGLAQDVIAHRAEVLDSAFERSPKRFKGKRPKPCPFPKAAWINKPNDERECKEQLISEACLCSSSPSRAQSRPAVAEHKQESPPRGDLGGHQISPGLLVLRNPVTE